MLPMIRIAVSPSIRSRLRVLQAMSDIARQWDDHYRRRTEEYSEEGDWWTLRAWRRYLFGAVLKDLAGKLVVDVGCGTAIRIATIAPIHEYGYRYIGIDSSPTV